MQQPRTFTCFSKSIYKTCEHNVNNWEKINKKILKKIKKNWDTWIKFRILPYVLMSTMVSPAMEIETGNATVLGHRKAPLSKQKR
jgi:hypothetical protein